MKTGSKVKICDGSYMLALKHGEWSHWGNFKSTKVIGRCTDTFTVITTGGKFPSEDEMKRRGKNNDTIIKNDANGEIWLCNARICLQEILKSDLLPELTMEQLIRIVGFEFKLV